MRVRAAHLIVAALLQAGCYNYLPLRRSGLVPSSYLAVTLTETGSEELARYLGPDALVVRGRYLAATEHGLTLSVESVESRRGGPFRRGGGAGGVARGLLRGGGARRGGRRQKGCGARG